VGVPTWTGRSGIAGNTESAPSAASKDRFFDSSVSGFARPEQHTGPVPSGRLLERIRSRTDAVAAGQASSVPAALALGQRREDNEREERDTQREREEREREKKREKREEREEERKEEKRELLGDAPEDGHSVLFKDLVDWLQGRPQVLFLLLMICVLSFMLCGVFACESVCVFN